jgi:hypothetical protein
VMAVVGTSIAVRPGDPACVRTATASQSGFKEVGRRYTLVVRALYLPYESPAQVREAVEPHRRALGQNVGRSGTLTHRRPRPCVSIENPDSVTEEERP